MHRRQARIDLSCLATRLSDWPASHQPGEAGFPRSTLLFSASRGERIDTPADVGEAMLVPMLTVSRCLELAYRSPQILHAGV